MRLQESVKHKLIGTLDETLHCQYELRLYGSRLDDNAKGGDIDLLLIIDKSTLSDLKKIKHRLLATLKKGIGEQKIDLTICSLEDTKNDPFLKLIYPQSEPLTC